jgi:hypothetical protein
MRQRILATLFVALVVSSAGLSRFAAAGNTVGLDGQAQPGGAVNSRSPRIRPEAGLIRYGSGNWRTLTNTRRYGVFIVGAANAKSAGAHGGRTLIYGCGVTIPNGSSSASCGVSWGDAAANNWLLKDANGKYVHGSGYPNEYLADIGNSSYQQRFISDMDSDMRAHRGVDGVFIDNVVGNLISVSDRYRDNASYRLAMLAFIKAVGPALRARGWYVAVNAGMNDAGAHAFAGETNDAQYIWWYEQIGPYVSGISTERWQQYWGSPGAPVRTSGAAWNQAWEGWERLPSVVASIGKDFYAITQGALTDTGKAAYLRASFLLAWTPGRGTFFYTDDYAGQGDPWMLVATPDIGRPLGPRRRIGVGFKRTFTSGIAVVNPSPSHSQTFGFRRIYRMGDGTTTRSITLPATSGLVLRRASLR